MNRAFVVLATVVALAACGRSEEPAPAPPAAPEAHAPAPVPAAAPAPKPGKNAQERLGESITLLLQTQPPPLHSYHLEMSSSGPAWDPKASAARKQSSTVKVDVQGESLHLTRTTAAEGGTPESFEGYAIADAAAPGGFREVEVGGGATRPSYGVRLAWALLPMELVGPVAIGSTGAKAQGQDSVDGRAAEKYEINTDNAPAGVMAVLGGNLDKVHGTAWVDAATGALLKLVVDSQVKVVKPGTSEVVGEGPHRVELQVTGVGKTTVTAPQ